MKAFVFIAAFLLPLLGSAQNQIGYILKEDVWIDPPSPQEQPFALNLPDLPVDQERLSEDGLFLRSRPLGIKTRDSLLWARDNVKPIPQGANRELDLAVSKNPDARLALTYAGRLEPRTLGDSPVDVRQWFKHYKEDGLRTLHHDSIAYLTDGQSICAFDEKTRAFLWKLSSNGAGRNAIHRVNFPPHQNSDNYGWSLSENKLVFAQNGSFGLLNIVDPRNPSLMWERSLAGYSSTTDPIVVGERIVMGLINSRTEVWLTGWNLRDGSLSWAQRICISSYLNPAGRLHYIKGNEFVFVTNHGFIVSGDAETGSVRWLRKYETRKYNLFDFWTAKESSPEVAPPEDSEFLSELNDALLIKPRESSHIYLLNRGDGSIIRDFPTDYRIERFLCLHGNWMLFLKIPARADESMSLIFKDVYSTRTPQQITLPSRGDLKGTLIEGNSLFFKIDTSIFQIDFASEGALVKATITRLATDSTFRLVGAGQKQFILANKDQLQLLEAIAPPPSPPKEETIEIKTSLKSGELARPSCVSGGKILDGIYENGFKYRLLSLDPDSEGQGGDYLLLVRGDQLLRVDSSGCVRWIRNILRAYALFDMSRYIEIKARLAHGVLLVNDGTNLYAIGPEDGRLIWSRYRKYDDGKIELYRLGSKWILAVDDRLLAINLQTGELEKEQSLSYRIQQSGIAGEFLYTINPQKWTVDLWSPDLDARKESPPLPKYLGTGNNKVLTTANGDYLLVTKQGLYTFDRESWAAKSAFPVDGGAGTFRPYTLRMMDGRHGILIFPGSFAKKLVFEPSGAISEAWNLDLATDNKAWSGCDVFCKNDRIPSFVSHETILVNTVSDGRNVLVAIDPAQGIQKWKTPLGPPDALFFHMSNIRVEDGTVSCAFSVVLGQEASGYHEIKSNYYEMSLENGAIVREVKIPEIGYRGFEEIQPVPMKDHVCFTANGYYLNCLGGAAGRK